MSSGTKEAKMEVKMLDNIGKTLKSLGKLLWVIGIVSAGIGVLTMFILVANEYTKVLWWIGLVAGAGCLVSCWLTSFFVYGFGELIDKQTEIAENTATIAENTATKGKQPTKKYNYYVNSQEQQFDSDDLPNI